MINNYSWDMDNPMNSIYHHQRLGAKWGKMNGPPYPLSPADYSAAQKKAVAEGEATVAKDAPKTSEKKTSSSSPKTEEEKAAEKEAKRKAALESGDVKQIEKYIKSSSYAELNEAMNKARTAQQIKDAIAKLDQNESSKSTTEEKPVTEEKPSFADRRAEKREEARQAALNSGDLNKIRAVANESSYKELDDAIKKADLMSSLNSKINDMKPVEPTVQDRINKAMDNVKTVTGWVTTGLETYNTVAKIYNSVNGDRSDLRFIGQDNSKIRTEAEKRFDNFKKDQEKKRKAAVEEAMRSGDASRLEKVAPLMTSDELKTAQAMVALRKNLKN